MGGKVSMGTTTKTRGKKRKSITLKKIEPSIFYKVTGSIIDVISSFFELNDHSFYVNLCKFKKNKIIGAFI